MPPSKVPLSSLGQFPLGWKEAWEQRSLGGLLRRPGACRVKSDHAAEVTRSGPTSLQIQADVAEGEARLPQSLALRQLGAQHLAVSMRSDVFPSLRILGSQHEGF